MDHPVYRGSYMPETASRPYRNSLTARRVMRSIGVPLLGRPLAFPRSCILLCTILTGGLFLSLVLEIFAITGTERERFAFEENRRFNDSVRLFSSSRRKARKWYLKKLNKTLLEVRKEQARSQKRSNAWQKFIEFVRLTFLNRFIFAWPLACRSLKIHVGSSQPDYPVKLWRITDDHAFFIRLRLITM